MRTAAVVGGTGFVGRAVVDALRARGWESRALSRRTGFDVLRPDPDALRGCAAVVNLAGIKREEGAQTFHVHVEAVERLVAAMKAADVRRLVHVSVAASKDKPAWPYHHSKWLGEKAARESGLDWTVLRPGVIYGDGDDLLSHLSLMIRASAVFPIAGRGTAPMMPVDVKDVARAAAAALEAAPGRTYDVVGPERLTLRETVARVAEAVGLPVRMLPTPLALLRPPVFLMEKMFRRPLSTRSQLNMLAEGLAGDPEPARRELGVEPAPFTPERLRPLIPAGRPPFDLRLLSAPRPAGRTPALPFAALLIAAFVLIGAGFAWGGDVWMSLLVGGAVLGLGSAAFPAARRFRMSPLRILAGAGIGLAQFGATKAALAGLSAAWPGWTSMAGALYAWKGPHSTSFLLPTLALIVLSEELLWRGVVTRFVAERGGRVAGILGGALLFGAAHLAAGNPLLVAAAFAAGAFWSWLAEACDDLTVPFVAHLVWDALLLFVWPVAG
jgi:uncharacterized protein YbjT (DUF2867 family)/membrane protease YdiL (CAAX protease family)